MNVHKRIDQLKKAFRCLLELCALIFFLPAGRLLRVVSKKHKNIWVIAERGYEARDNAYHFFKFMTQNAPQIRAVYMIDKHSKDLEKVQALGEVVYRNSFKHRLYLCAAQRLVSTHVMGYAPDMGAYFRLARAHVSYGIRIFLQHGIIKDDMKFMHKEKNRVDLFVTSAKGEYDFICQKYGHEKDVVQLLGLPRYDALYDCAQKENKKILFMPTWREWIALHDGGDFTQTAYFKNINGLLTSSELHEMLEKHHITLFFYPHYEMQRFIHHFTPSKNVVICSFEHYDVQALLKECNLLITDFSSVFFDFAYMKKPEIFFQFDEETFRQRQYKEGYFTYRKDAFGEVVTDIPALLQAVQACITQDFKVQKIYEDRIDNFFYFHDHNNCARCYKAIEETTKRRE